MIRKLTTKDYDEESLMENILIKLECFGISTTAHGQTALISHLKGTYQILRKWNSEEDVCLAGLCHSLYGTESFSKTPATLENRGYVQNIIGKEAETLAYLFGAHRKNSLWPNLDRQKCLTIEDRFSNQILSISTKNFSDLITITLANWLEQRPRAAPEYQFIRQEEFLRAKPFLTTEAFKNFLLEYGLP